MSRTYRTLGSVALIAVVALAGCQKKEAPPPVANEPAMPAPAPTLSVSAIELGNAIGPDKNVAAPMNTFTRKDTIYTAVMTEGAPPTATLTAVWTFVRGTQTARVDSTSQTISPTGPATTEFHVSKPSGWPIGKYTVEIWADGKSVGIKEFEIK